MKRTVVYHALSLLSERDEKARRVTFSPTHNLLAGENETGKSRILKHVVWALGCDPSARNAGNWDSNIVASLELSIDGKRFTFVRAGMHQRAAFDADGELLLGTENPKKWVDFFAETFGYPLKLQRPKEGAYALAGPEYAVLPFYIDQEGGWGKKWSNFTKLGQFSRWEKPVLESFTGLRPLKYFDLQLTRDDMAQKLKEAEAQVKVQASSYAQVRAMLPATEAKLDEGLFAQELKDMSARVALLGEEEDKVRQVLFETTQQMQDRTSDLKLAIRAESDLVEDLAYLTKIPDDGTIACPTCGQEHGVSFRARFDLASDAKDAHQLVIQVREQLRKLRDEEDKLRVKLKNVAAQMAKLQTSMEHAKGDTSVSDVVIAKSLDTIAKAYERTARAMKERIETIQGDKDELDKDLAMLIDTAKMKLVRTDFKNAMKSHADRLNVAAEEIKSVTIGSRPAVASGSSGPRIYLAMHLALLEAHAKHGAGPTFPFIVDTPRQQGLDDNNTAKLLTAIYNHAAATQIFVANESVPTNWAGRETCKVIEFNEKRNVLSVSEYLDEIKRLAPFIPLMQAAIRAERDEAAKTGDVVEEVVIPDAADDEDENDEE